MILLAALTTILLGLSNITVVTCEEDWLDRDMLTQMLGAELSELPETERADLIAVVDECSDTSVRLRVVKSNRGRERRISLVETPESARLRTVVLALGELARENEVTQAPPPQNTASVGQGPTEQADTPETHRKTSLPTPQTTPRMDDEVATAWAEQPNRTTHEPRASAQLFARGFPWRPRSHRRRASGWCLQSGKSPWGDMPWVGPTPWGPPI